MLILAGASGVHHYRGSNAGATRRTPATDPIGSRNIGAEARKAFRIACQANDAKGAAQALLDWAQVSWTGEAPRNLGALAAHLARGGGEVCALERRLYAPASSPWDEAVLWRVLQGELPEARAAKRTQRKALEPLYPHRG